jgi:transcriptional regulator with XRE-family HTH domain
MTLKDAIEKEIAAQGISAIDISKASGVSKATIYNILNGLTDDIRIRPSTKRAIARGCGRELKILGDGGVAFVAPPNGGETQEAAAALWLRYAPGRPFLQDGFCREAFDWLHEMEVAGRIPPSQIVNRVFQKRLEFLSLVIENLGGVEISTAAFSLDVSIPRSRVQRSFPISAVCPIAPGGRAERTVFPDRAEFDFEVEVSQVVLRDADGGVGPSAWEPQGSSVYRFKRNAPETP